MEGVTEREPCRGLAWGRQREVTSSQTLVGQRDGITVFYLVLFCLHFEIEYIWSCVPVFKNWSVSNLPSHLGNSLEKLQIPVLVFPALCLAKIFAQLLNLSAALNLQMPWKRSGAWHGALCPSFLPRILCPQILAAFVALRYLQRFFFLSFPLFSYFDCPQRTIWSDTDNQLMEV